MKKMPHLEINTAPSMLNTSPVTGVAAQLAQQAKNEPHYDGVPVEMMRDNPLYTKHDKIDKIGLAQNKVAKAGDALSKSKFVREMNRKMQHPSKPKTN